MVPFWSQNLPYQDLAVYKPARVSRRVIPRFRPALAAALARKRSQRGLCMRAAAAVTTVVVAATAKTVGDDDNEDERRSLPYLLLAPSPSSYSTVQYSNVCTVPRRSRTRSPRGFAYFHGLI